jgi:hypothetical protein
MLTEKELNAIEARANAATAGPWAMAEYHPQTMLLYPIGNPVTQELLAYPIQGGENSQNNAAFIAYAREDVPALLAYIRELHAELNRYDTHAISVALLHRAATTDGAHHKQWLIVRILEAMGEDISDYDQGVQP